MDDSSAEETRVIEEIIEVELMSEREHSKDERTEETCPKTEDQEQSGDTVTSPVKRKSELAIHEEVKRKRSVSPSRKMCDEKNLPGIPDVQTAVSTEFMEKSKETSKNIIEIPDNMKMEAVRDEKVGNPFDQSTSIEIMEESSETHVISSSLNETRFSKELDQPKTDSLKQTLGKQMDSSARNRREIPSNLVSREISKKLSAEQDVKSKKQAPCDAIISSPVESKSEIKDEEIKQSFITNIKSQECAEEAIADISKVLHTVLKVGESEKCMEISTSSIESSDNVKEKSMKVETQPDKSNIEAHKDETDPASPPIAKVKSPTRPQIEGLAARIMLNVKISTSQALHVMRNKTNNNESDNQTFSKTSDPVLLEKTPSRCRETMASANLKDDSYHTRDSPESSFKTQTLLHPIYIQPETKYVPIEQYHKDAEFVETQKQILASLKQQTKATQKNVSDQNVDPENKTQEMLQHSNQTINPSEIKQTVKSDPLLPAEDHNASNKNKYISGTDCAEFREYPGLANEPSKVKKDARYQKKFYKQQNPVKLPVNWKEDRISSGEQNIDLEGNKSEDAESTMQSHPEGNKSEDSESTMQSHTEGNRSEDAENTMQSHADDRECESVKSDDTLTLSNQTDDCKTEKSSQLDNLPETQCAIERKISSARKESKSPPPDSCKSIKTSSGGNDSQSTLENIAQLEGLAARIASPTDETSTSEEFSLSPLESAAMRWISFDYNFDLTLNENSICFREIRTVPSENTSTRSIRLIPYLTVLSDVEPIDDGIYSIEEMLAAFNQCRRQYHTRDPRLPGWEFGIPVPIIPLYDEEIREDESEDVDDDSMEIDKTKPK